MEAMEGLRPIIGGSCIIQDVSADIVLRGSGDGRLREPGVDRPWHSRVDTGSLLLPLHRRDCLY